MPRPKYISVDEFFSPFTSKKKLKPIIIEEDEPKLTHAPSVKKKFTPIIIIEEEEPKLTPGAKANDNGKKFEKKVSLTNTFIHDDSFIVKHIGTSQTRTYLYKETISADGETVKYYFFKQRLFQHYLTEYHSFDKLTKIPDEVVMIEKGDTRVLKIIEIKWQQVDGSASEKIYGAPMLKKIYEHIFATFGKVEVCYVLSPFLIKKYEKDNLFVQVVKPTLIENKIPYFGQNQLSELKEFVIFI